MSLIFDALQRSEGERPGADLSALSSVTELLQRVEQHQAVSALEASLEPELGDATRRAGRDGSFVLQTAPSSNITDAPPVASEPSLNNKRPELFDEFQPLSISVASKSQLVCLTDGESLVAEKFRFLAVRLRHLQRERPLKRVLITSSIPREGKSTVAANLACTLARKKQQRTLLIEGDVRRPSLSQLFGLQGKPGLCDWLQGNDATMKDIYHLEGLGLWILPAGSASGNPLELLQTGRLSALMSQLTALFDWLIIDSPPVLPLADTSVWSRLADGILLVARQGITEKRQLQRGLEALDHQKLIGALLNSSHSSATSDHYYYYRPSSAPGAAGNPTEK
jgi:capsular exopolysaccharide synthesis family protein